MGRIEARLQKIPIEPRLAAGEEEHLAGAAEPLRGARVLLVSPAPPEASDCGAALAASLAGLGLEAERGVLHGNGPFQAAGRDLADALRGAPWQLAEERWRDYREACEAAAIAADPRSYDAVLVHGAAAAPLIEGRRGGPTAWLWRTGQDLSAPDDAAQEAAAPLLDDYASLAFGAPAFALRGAAEGDPGAFPPAIDSPAGLHRDLEPAAAGALLRPLGVRLDRPLVCSLGRLDAWADPPAAIEAWRQARREHPGLQLAIAGRLDPADPGATEALDEARAFADGEEDLLLLTDRGGAGDLELNAVGRIARCAIHLPLGDELDPGVSASLRRGTPVLGAGEGAAAQIEDGRDGHLVEGPEECGERIAALVGDPGRSAAMGRAGRRRVLAQGGLAPRLAFELESIGSSLGMRPQSVRAAA
jgi:glycosyltransferase involved in cell wall biosynthesis